MYRETANEMLTWYMEAAEKERREAEDRFFLLARNPKDATWLDDPEDGEEVIDEMRRQNEKIIRLSGEIDALEWAISIVGQVERGEREA